MVVPFLPATNIFFRVGFVVAERVLYLSSIGSCLLTVLGFTLLSKFPLGKKVSKGLTLDIWSLSRVQHAHMACNPYNSDVDPHIETSRNPRWKTMLWRRGEEMKRGMHRKPPRLNT